MVMNSRQRTAMVIGQSSTKTERKIIEKNRRNQMKTLYAQLNSLVPHHGSKEALPLPDQIDEAIKYIKSLEEKLRTSKEKKETLMRSCRKRSYDCTTCYEAPPPPPPSSSFRPPQLEIREIGPALEIVLITGTGNQFLLCDLMRILQEEGLEIVSANFRVTGNSIFHVVHAQMSETAVFGFGPSRVTERLNMFINGSTSEIELDAELWDFELLPHQTWNWEF